MDSSNAEQAYRRYSHRLGVPKPIRGTQDWNDERVAFMAAWSARDAEVEALREQLAAAEAVIEKAKAAVPISVATAYDTLDTAPSSVLAAVKAEVWDEGYRHAYLVGVKEGATGQVVEYVAPNPYRSEQ